MNRSIETSPYLFEQSLLNESREIVSRNAESGSVLGANDLLPRSQTKDAL